MSMVKPSHGMANFQLKIKFVFLWIILPALILTIIVLIAARFCFKSSLNVINNASFIEEMDAPPAPIGYQ
jgi:hypothetical protein